MNHNPTRFTAFTLHLLMLILLAGLSPTVFAQEIAGDPEEQFFMLLYNGDDMDEARAGVADVHGAAVATEIAIWVCYEFEDDCAGTSVGDAWDLFLESLYGEELSLMESVDALLEEMRDDYLAFGVALYWCSPEPEDGCEGEPAQQIWLDFDRLIENDEMDPGEVIARLNQDYPAEVVELVAASYCGHPNCYADEIAMLSEEEKREISRLDVVDVEVEKEGEKRKTNVELRSLPRSDKGNSGGETKFLENPGSPKKDLGKKLRCALDKSKCG